MRFPDTPGYCRVVLTLYAPLDIGSILQEAGYDRSSQDYHWQRSPKEHLALQMLVGCSHRGAHALQCLEGGDGSVQKPFAIACDDEAVPLFAM